MIQYWFHIAYIYIGSRFFWKQVDLHSDLTRTRRVSLLDCEAFRFMNNSKYFIYMDLIRFEILFRTNMYKATINKGVFPVLGSQKIIYRRPLKRWQKFDITLKLEGWDDKWVYHKQVFTRKDEVYAIGITKVAFLKQNKIQNMDEILALSGMGFKEKEVSDTIKALFENDTAILKI